MSRPYFNSSIAQLEALYAKALECADDVLLANLAHELRSRETQRAMQLRKRVLIALKDKSVESAQSKVDAPVMPPEEVQRRTFAMIEPKLIDRMKGLLDYVIQTAKMKASPVLSVERHGKFKAYEYEMRGLPGIEFNSGSQDDDVWVRISRLHETAPPVPKAALLAILIEQSKDPAKLPGLITLVERERVMPLGIELPVPTSESDVKLPLRVADLPAPVNEQVRADLKNYISQQWQPWAD